MILTKSATLLGLGLVLTISAVGCKTHPYGPTNLDRPRSDSGGTTTPGLGTGLKDGEGVEGKPTALSSPENHKDWLRDAEIFKSDTAHFDYDSSAIKAEDKPKVAAVAAYLKEHSM